MLKEYFSNVGAIFIGCCLVSGVIFGIMYMTMEFAELTRDHPVIGLLSVFAVISCVVGGIITLSDRKD